MKQGSKQSDRYGKISTNLNAVKEWNRVINLRHFLRVPGLVLENWLQPE